MRALLIFLSFCFTGALWAAVDTIEPGEIWRDNRGKHIQAHGGSVLKVGDVWYWFGEDRTAEDGKSGKPRERWIACYASQDLMRWEFRARVAGGPPPEKELGTPYVFERPKVFHNAKTGKFVMYVHLDDARYHYARVGVFVSDKVDGPYQFVHSFRPHQIFRSLEVTSCIIRADYQNSGQGLRDQPFVIREDGKPHSDPCWDR